MGPREDLKATERRLAALCPFFLGGGGPRDGSPCLQGIHDCWAPQRVNATAYKANLETIYEASHAALAPGGKVVWTATTPVATNCGSPKAPRGPCYGVAPACVAQYNQIAADLLGSKPDVLLNDVCVSTRLATPFAWTD